MHDLEMYIFICIEIQQKWIIQQWVDQITIYKLYLKTSWSDNDILEDKTSCRSVNYYNLNLPT